MINCRPTTSSCTFGDGKRVQADQVGDVVLEVDSTCGATIVVLQDVLHIPSLPCALLSTTKLRAAGGTFVDSAKMGSYIQLPNSNKLPLKVNTDTNFMQLDGRALTSADAEATAFASLSNKRSRLTLLQWHTVLGHLHPAAIKYLEKRGLIEVSDAATVADFTCNTCKECKSEALSFARGGRAPKVEPGEIVHTDLEGPFKTDVNGFKYFQIFVDEATRDKRVVGLRTKDAAVAATKSYLDTMQQSDVYVKCLSGDGAGELGRSGKFQRMLTERHVRWRKSPPYTPQANGLAERGIKSLMSSARSSLSRSGRGERFWFFAVADAAYKSSGMPHEYLGGETPHERLTGKPFNYDRLRAFGTECYVHQFKKQRGSNSKFHPYAKRGFIVGHDRESSAWHVWLSAEEKMVTSAHVTFSPEPDALDFLDDTAIVDLGKDSAEVIEQQPKPASEEEVTSIQQAPNVEQHQTKTVRFDEPNKTTLKSKLVRPTPRYPTLQGHANLPDNAKSNTATSEQEEITKIVQRLSQSDDAFCFIGLHSIVPTSNDEPTLQEAMDSDHAKEWQEAIDAELAGMWKKGVFTDEPMPAGKTPVGTKFVLKIKRKADGTVERFKARLVAQGFSQQRGIDFHQTFSPVVSTDVLRTILALAAANKWTVSMLDFTQAYLNADIDTDLWVKLPDNNIVKVKKALYGFKQSALQWYDELRNTITTVEEWQPSQFDDCLYYKVSDDNKIAILGTYVDDLISTGDYNVELQRMKKSLLNTYQGRDIGTPDQLLGVQIKVESNIGINLDQIRYAADIVTGILGSLEVRKTSTPIDPGMDITATRSNEDVLDASYMYSHHVGKLMYLAGMTRPDLSNAVRELGRRASSPCMRHWRALQHVARYLAGTLSVSIMYSKNVNNNMQDVLVGYSDADWATDTESRRSVTGYILLFDGSPVAWKSKSQTSITCSSSEAEWTAMAHGMRHAVHIRGLLRELTFPQQTSTWHEDNQGALRAGTIIGFTGRTRHVDVQLKLTREYVMQGHFKVVYTSTREQLADALTKRVTGPKLQQFVHALLWTQ
jgi:Reverse transcriptase (RNA-dependent DNA polymerase)